MEVSYIFYKELPVLEENIFSMDLTENNEVEDTKLKKDKQHLATSMKINQKTVKE